MNKLIALGLISLTSMFMLAYGYMYNPKAGYLTPGVAGTGYGALSGLWEFLVFIIILIIIAGIFDFNGGKGGGKDGY